MKTIEEILPRVLLSGLLGPTPSRVAAALGYRGRTTLTRIMTREAGDNALKSFCARLEERLGITVQQLTDFDRYLDEAADFLRLCRSCDLAFADALIALTVCDYGRFRSVLAPSDLAALIALREHTPLQFASLLSIIYFRDQANTLESLGRLLTGAFPDNHIGRYVCGIAPQMPPSCDRYPAGLKQIELGRSVITAFFPEAAGLSFGQMLPLPGVAVRSYWRSDAMETTWLLKAVSVLGAANVYYDIFRLGPETSADYEGQIQFTGSGAATYIPCDVSRNGGECAAWARYETDGRQLRLCWHSEERRWEPGILRLLDPADSQTLRRYDRALTDSYLAGRQFAALNVAQPSGLVVRDVAVSREAVTLLLADGRRLAIGRDSRQLLNQVTPDMYVLVYDDRDDRTTYVEWPDLGLRIASEEFTVT